jgi:hypothetical protein
MPVLVTGIQPPRVRAVRGGSYLRGVSGRLSRRRRGALDSCDGHRNDGEGKRCLIRILLSYKVVAKNRLSTSTGGWLMASLTYIPSSALVSLLMSADPHKRFNVRVISPTQLSLETASFQQVSVIDLTNEKVIIDKILVPEPVAVPKASRRSGKYQLRAFDMTIDTYSLKDLLGEGLRILEKHKPGMLEKLSHVKARTKKIVARNPADLFDTPGLSNEFAQKLTDEWWYGTNNSTPETIKWLKRACDCGGVKWGADLSVSP